jgi:hypothetical protein
VLLLYALICSLVRREKGEDRVKMQDSLALPTIQASTVFLSCRRVVPLVRNQDSSVAEADHDQDSRGLETETAGYRKPNFFLNFRAKFRNY